MANDSRRYSPSEKRNATGASYTRFITGLWEGQTDEGELGFTYKDADAILSLHFDEKKSAEDIVTAGFSKDIVDKVLTRARSNDFKHHLPILP